MGLTLPTVSLVDNNNNNNNNNQGHNTGRHRSKGAVEKENRGRVGLKALSGKRGVHKSLAKIDRRNKAVQLRKAAREEVRDLIANWKPNN